LSASPSTASRPDSATPLAGQTALITGAGRGIGRAIAIRYAAAGAAVVGCARSSQEVAETLELIRRRGGEGIARAADVRDAEAMERLAQAAVERFGHLDVAVLNAGVNPPHARVEAIPPEVWRATVETNLTGVYLGLRAVVPHLRRSGGGKVLVIGSGAARRAPVGLGAYAAAKAGLSALVRVASRELRSDHITVNELQPGPTATAMHGVSESDPADTLAEREVVLEEGLEDDQSIAGEWFKSPRSVADFALALVTLPNPGPSGQIFSLNSTV
jgi:3-oxoacyl-[acyl-carrier protein] reductase